MKPKSITKEFSILGAGEIKGVDANVIIRTYPPPSSQNIETNYFPFIEFDQPDFLEV